MEFSGKIRAEHYFHEVGGDSRESPQTCNSQFLALRSAIRKKRVQFGNPETIRENQAIRANRFTNRVI